MNSSRRLIKPRILAATMAAFVMLAAVAAAPSHIFGLGAPAASGASITQLSSQLAQQQARQQSLAGSLASLSHLISTLDGQIALVQAREAAVRADLARDRQALADAQHALTREQALLAQLRAQLARARTLLSRQLLSSYEGTRPDLVSVLLEAHGFTDLLEKFDFLHRAQQQQQAIISVTRAAKVRADSAAQRLAKLEATDRQITDQTTLRVRALAGMNSLLATKQGALQQARAAQQAALSASQARGQQLQSAITQLQAQQAAAQRAAAASAAAAAASSASSASSSSASSSSSSSSLSSATPTASGPTLGPSGGWAIPYAIVLCESGGQDLSPNSAGASGYYQIIPATWKLFGGSGPAAYLASKAEQDAVASRIWNGGAGASNWVCAGIVGIH